MHFFRCNCWCICGAESTFSVIVAHAGASSGADDPLDFSEIEQIASGIGQSPRDMRFVELIDFSLCRSIFFFFLAVVLFNFCTVAQQATCTRTTKVRLTQTPRNNNNRSQHSLFAHQPQTHSDDFNCQINANHCWNRHHQSHTFFACTWSCCCRRRCCAYDLEIASSLSFTQPAPFCSCSS